MRHIFMDESGDLGFGAGGSSFFVLAFISPESGKALNKCVKNFNAHLISNGWNKDVEIKGSNIWTAAANKEIPSTYKYKNNPMVPLEYILEAISKIEGYIEYTAIKLDTVSAGLQTAPSAILYNYFSWLLLKGPLCYFPAVSLFIDRRNREYHNQLKFNGYLESKVGIERAEKKIPAIALGIKHYHQNSANECKSEERAMVEFGVRGIEAADFVCWAIKSKFEHKDERWFKLIGGNIKWKQHLYF